MYIYIYISGLASVYKYLINQWRSRSILSAGRRDQEDRRGMMCGPRTRSGRGPLRRRWWITTAAALAEVRGGAGGEPRRRWWRRWSRRRGSRETTAAKTMNPAALERRRRRRNYGSRATAWLYRAGPFSTGPWLEPVLKGL